MIIIGSMKNWFLCFLFATSIVFGAEFRLKERLEKAKSGDYIVTEANKMITLLAIRSNSPNTLILEEISAPVNNLKKTPHLLGRMGQGQGPGHTSWSMVEIDLQTGQVLECYSFSRSAWIQISQNESLIATLLHLPMKSLSPDKRRRIGPPPMAGEPDVRKVWNPPFIFEGQKVENVHFDVFETTWPKDGTELANQDVSLYFDKEKQFPLPFWIQVETSHATAALRTIDSGKNLPALYRSLPRRIPEFIGHHQKTDQGIRLSLKSPKYYRQFELFAIDITTREKQICPITHSLVQGEEEFLTIEIDEEDLKETLQPSIATLGSSSPSATANRPLHRSTKE